jgi:formylglycine-generating enzyme required for sulfatase activity
VNNFRTFLLTLTIGMLLGGGLFVLPWLVGAQPQRGQGTRPPQAAAAGRYYALLIAVQHYRHPSVNPLDYPLADAQRVQRVLTVDYSFEPQDVALLRDPDRDMILAALEQLAEKLRAEDHLLIFYAGHGQWDEQRRQGYWLPANAQRGRRADWISNSDLRDAIRALPARHTLLVSDACFSGGIFVAREAFTRSAAIEELSRLPSRNAMTSGALTTVPDRSVFVQYLLKRLGENREPYLPAADLFSQLRTAVINNSPRQPDGTIPTPRYGVIQEAGDEGGDFIFVRRSSSFTPMPTPTLRPTPTPTPVPTPVARMSAAGVPLVAMSFTTANTDAQGRLVNRRTEQCWGYVEDLGGATLEMVEVPGGEFLMGSPANEAERHIDEGLQHRVRVPGFAMGKYEVTQAQWRAVAKWPKVKIDLNPDPANFKGDNLPVEQVRWEEAVEFCERLKRQTGRAYRLPTEAEWEYATRAGTTTPFAFGPTVTPDIVNYNGNYSYGAAEKGSYRQKTVPVGSLGVANAFGLFDLHGNVYEWCQDVWHESYNSAPTDGSAWLIGGNSSQRVLRGGSWFSESWSCRSADRESLAPGDIYPLIGMRVVSALRTP